MLRDTLLRGPWNIIHLHLCCCEKKWQPVPPPPPPILYFFFSKMFNPLSPLPSLSLSLSLYIILCAFLIFFFSLSLFCHRGPSFPRPLSSFSPESRIVEPRNS